MKKLTLFCFLSLPLLGHTQTAIVQIVGQAYPVEFADTNLSAISRHRIASDLTTVFELTPSFEQLKGREISPGVFQFGDALMFTSGEEKYLSIVATNNSPSIWIKEALSDKYQQAFALVDAHSNTIQKAHEFVTLLNSTNLLSLSPVQVIRQICHITPDAETNDPPNEELDAIQRLAANFLQWRYPGFSVLNFSSRQVLDLGEAAEYPVILLFTVDKSTPSKMFAFPMVFYNGKWRFGGRVPELEAL